MRPAVSGCRETTLARPGRLSDHPAAGRPRPASIAWTHDRHAPRRPRRHRPDRPRPHPVRHHQPRRGPVGGGDGGRGVRRAASQGPGARARAHRRRARPHERPRAHPGTQQGQARARRPRPPRRGPGRPRELVGRPVRRRHQGRHALGPRRRGHEEHGRDDDHGAAGDHHVRPRPRARPDHGLLLRRGGGRRARLRLRRREPARVVRGRHRGDQRGRRLLHRPRREARLPAADGREGPGLDPPRRHRHRRSRLAGQPRQRRHAPRRCGRPDRHGGVARPPHRHDAPAARRDRPHRRGRPDAGDPRRPRDRHGHGVEVHRRDAAHDHEPDAAPRGLQSTT